MNIAILGGGFTGLTAAHDLSQKKHTVTVYEREEVLGGLAHGFKEEGWEWPLERAYHHIFASDADIIAFAREVDFKGVFFQSPATDSLYPDQKGNYRIFPVDSPLDFLRFPLMSVPNKLRAAAMLAFLKISPPLKVYERYTAVAFTRKFMGSTMWEVFFEQLFRKKFGKYAEKVLASFLWARISKRTKSLGYMQGGFQTFIDHIETADRALGATIHKGVEIKNITKKDNKFLVEYVNKSDNKKVVSEYDAVISTLPTPVLCKVGERILPQQYVSRLKKIEYLNALVLIVQTDKPILKKTYWLNINDPKLPMMFVGQHTNFIDKKYYGGNHIAYVANYIPHDDVRLKMTNDEVLAHYLPSLQKIADSKFAVSKFWVFKAPFAQPIFDKNFLKNKPDFITPVKYFYIANLDMTYPYDRGTNYAVKLGRIVAGMVP